MPHLSTVSGSISQYRLVVRDHLAASREAHQRSIEAAVVFFERLAVATATGEQFDAVERPEPRHVASAAGLDVVAAREVELPVVEPPRHVDVHAARAVLVVRNAVHHRGHDPADVGSGRIRQVLAHRAARVGQSGWKLRTLRVEQQACGLAGARREHDDPRAHVAIASVGGVHVGDAGREAVLVGRDLARHRVGRNRQAARGDRRRQQHRRRREIRVHRAAAAALSAVVACGPAIQRARQDRLPGRHAGDPEPIAGLLHQQLVAARAAAAAERCRPARSADPRRCRRCRRADRARRSTASGRRR